MNFFKDCFKSEDEIETEPDVSLDNFFTKLYNKIKENRLQKSVICFKYSNMTTNELIYKTILAYENNYETSEEPFYSQFNKDHPEIKILRIGEIVAGRTPCRCHRPHLNDDNGISHLNFAVYYEKYEAIEPKITVSMNNLET